jgi:diguanylate cyclase (GGDEF)-like protein/PAS domain S-box-containing protein
MKTDTAPEKLNTTIVSLVFLMVLFIVAFLAVIIISYTEILDIAEKNSRNYVEQSHKMLITGEMAELARSRTRLTAQITDIEDVFVQDELNAELEHYANRYAALRAELFQLSLDDAERAILEAFQPGIVAKILPAQRKAVEMSMSSDAADRQRAKEILYRDVLPGQQELVDSFHTLVRLQQSQIAEQATSTLNLLGETEKKIFQIIIAATVLTLVLLTIVVTRIQRIQIQLKTMNENLELMVFERTYELEYARNKLQRSLGILDKNVITVATDLNGIITDASQAFCRASGYAVEDLSGNHISMLRHPDDTSGFFDDLQEKLETGEMPEGEAECSARDNTAYWVKIIFDRIINSQGETIGYTAIMQDITDKKRIERLSVTDSLTGLYNRMKIDEVLENEAMRSSRYGTSLSIVLFDVDYFKKINDTFGHQVGDITLIMVAEVVRDRTREVDIAGRWGGEEFMVVCPQTGIRGARELAEELRMAVSSRDFGEVDEVTCSFGVAEYSRGENIEDVLLRVDTALYRAKREGRNRVILAD